MQKVRGCQQRGTSGAGSIKSQLPGTFNAPQKAASFVLHDAGELTHVKRKGLLTAGVGYWIARGIYPNGSLGRMENQTTITKPQLSPVRPMGSRHFQVFDQKGSIIRKKLPYDIPRRRKT